MHTAESTSSRDRGVERQVDAERMFMSTTLLLAYAQAFGDERDLVGAKVLALSRPRARFLLLELRRFENSFF